MSDLEFPFDKQNTALVPLLHPMVARAVSLGLSQPWVVAPIEDLMHHCQTSMEDSQYKLTLLALRDQGVRYLVLPPRNTSIENILGDCIAIQDRVEADNSDSLL